MTSVTRKFHGENVSHKVAHIHADFWGYFEKHHCSNKS